MGGGGGGLGSLPLDLREQSLPKLARASEIVHKEKPVLLLV